MKPIRVVNPNTKQKVSLATAREAHAEATRRYEVGLVAKFGVLELHKRKHLVFAWQHAILDAVKLALVDVT